MAVVVAVTLERPPPALPQGNLALGGAYSALHQVGLLTTSSPRLVPRCCFPAKLLDLHSFDFHFSIFSFSATLSICAPFVGFLPRPSPSSSFYASPTLCQYSQAPWCLPVLGLWLPVPAPSPRLATVSAHPWNLVFH